jgi:NhaA family Na+:H+ antiporter
MASRTLGLSPDIAGGLILALAALAGILFKNVDLLAPLYNGFLEFGITAPLGGFGLTKPLRLWINDGLMAIFFLVVALEIKRELYLGALSSVRKAALPVIAAAGGMIVPAFVFLGIVGIESAEARGWAIPAATDIAFAISVLRVFGSRVPPALRTFLLAVAIVDDFGAIVVIALFYTADLSPLALMAAFAILALLAAMNRLGVRKALPYVLLGLMLWLAVLKSDVHATLAGVALGFLIPLRPDAGGSSMAERWEHALLPWSVFLVMPAFAFANAGVDLGVLSLADLGHPVTLGIIGGLFLGKQAGILGASWIAIRTGLAEMPQGATWARFYGVALLAGIGFTMSLFIGSLAYQDSAMQNYVKLGVIAGSLLSGIAGAAVLGIMRPVRAAAAV